MSAKQRDENGSSSWLRETTPGLVLLSLYIEGGFLDLRLNSTRKANVPQQYIGGEKYSVWGGIRSYGGLVLDVILLPQVLLNAFRGSAEKALCNSFYVGTSVVRLAPHAYNLYRSRNYAAFDLKKTYYYANPDVGFYSRDWDVILPLGILTLALIIFLQQLSGVRR